MAKNLYFLKQKCNRVGFGECAHPYLHLDFFATLQIKESRATLACLYRTLGRFTCYNWIPPNAVKLSITAIIYPRWTATNLIWSVAKRLRRRSTQHQFTICYNQTNLAKDIDIDNMTPIFGSQLDRDYYFWDRDHYSCPHMVTIAVTKKVPEITLCCQYFWYNFIYCNISTIPVSNILGNNREN